MNIKNITPLQRVSSANCVINKFSDFSEIVFYKNDFPIISGEVPEYVDLDSGEIFKKEIDRSCTFIKDGDILLCKDSSVTIAELKSRIRKSCARSLDNFYGYALCNDWNYFVTITVSAEYVREDDECVKKLWSDFVRKVTRRKDFAGIKMLSCAERHPSSGALHFHSLWGICDLTNYITPAVSHKRFVKNENGEDIPNEYYGKQLYTRLNHPLYNFALDKNGSCVLWNKGYVTVAELPIDGTIDTRLKVSNYLIGYVTKENNLGLHKKRYYRTQNLDFKNKTVSKLDKKDLDNMTNKLSCVVYKENDRMTVYRIYNDFDKKIIKK